MKLGLPETSEDVPLRNAEPSEDNKSESSKLRLKIKKQLKLYGNLFGGNKDTESFENYR